MIDYTIIYLASSDKPRELINLTFVSKTHGKSEISLLSAHYCPMDTWHPHNTEQHAHTQAYEMYLCLCSACVNLRGETYFQNK